MIFVIFLLKYYKNHVGIYRHLPRVKIAILCFLTSFTARKNHHFVALTSFTARKNLSFVIYFEILQKSRRYLSSFTARKNRNYSENAKFKQNSETAAIRSC